MMLLDSQGEEIVVGSVVVWAPSRVVRIGKVVSITDYGNLRVQEYRVDGKQFVFIPLEKVKLLRNREVVIFPITLPEPPGSIETD